MLSWFRWLRDTRPVFVDGYTAADKARKEAVRARTTKKTLAEEACARDGGHEYSLNSLCVGCGRHAAADF